MQINTFSVSTLRLTETKSFMSVGLLIYALHYLESVSTRIKSSKPQSTIRIWCTIDKSVYKKQQKLRSKIFQIIEQKHLCAQQSRLQQYSTSHCKKSLENFFYHSKFYIESYQTSSTLDSKQTCLIRLAFPRCLFKGSPSCD